MAKDPGRTEKATPKRRDKARKKGNVPRSAEVGKTITVVVGLIFLYLWIGHMGTEIQVFMRHTFSHFFEFQVNRTALTACSIQPRCSRPNWCSRLF
jgi:Flagellar biosynthesis pathway, component FlhB